MGNKSYIKQVNYMILGIALIIPIASTAISVLFALIPSLYEYWGVVQASLFTEAMFLFPTLCYFLIARPKFLEIIRIRKIRISTVFLALLACALFSPIAIFLNRLSMLFVPNEMVARMDSLDGQPMALILLIFAIIAPITEEFICRGVILCSYRKTANRAFAVIVSAFIFGLMHGNLNQTPYAFAVGIFFALLFEATGSIITPFIAHMAFNGWNVSIYLLMQAALPDNIIKAADSASDPMMSFFESYSERFGVNLLLLTIASFAFQLFIALIFCFLSFLVLKFIAKLENRTQSFKALFNLRAKGEPIFTISLLIAVLIFIFYIVMATFF